MTIALILALVVVLVFIEIQACKIDRQVDRLENETVWRQEQNDKLLLENKDLKEEIKRLENFINSNKGGYMKKRERTLKETLLENMTYLKFLKDIGKSYKQIAEQFGCSQSTIMRIFKQ